MKEIDFSTLATKWSIFCLTVALNSNNRFEFKTVMVVDLTFDRLSQNYLQLLRSPSMFKLFMIADDSLFSFFAPDDNLLFEGIRVSLIGVQNLIIIIIIIM